jgi:hypothetical protein
MVTDLATEVWEVLRALPTWQGFVVVVGCSPVLAVLVRVGGDALIRRLTRTIPGDVDKIIFRSVHPPLYVTVVLAGVFVAVRLLEVATDWTDLLEAGRGRGLRRGRRTRKLTPVDERCSRRPSNRQGVRRARPSVDDDRRRAGDRAGGRRDRAAV